jgi:hypothetical protein
MMFLCALYQKLETTFLHSPQKVHLTHTMAGLFESMANEDKVKIYKQFHPLMQKRHVPLWSVLRITNLPIDFQRTIEEDIIDKFKIEYEKFGTGPINGESIYDMV